MAAKRSPETDPLGNQGGGHDFIHGHPNPLGNTGGGSDILQGGGGSDILQGGGGSDILQGQQALGPDTPLSPGQQPPGPPGREVMVNPQPLPPGGGGGPDQPLVSFEGGDPSHPYVVGDLYSSKEHGSSDRPDESIGFQYGELKTPYTKQQGGGGEHYKEAILAMRKAQGSGGGAGKEYLKWIGVATAILLLLGLIGGGVAIIPRFFPPGGVPLSPGVIAWEGQGNAQGPIASDKNGTGPDVTTPCRKAGGNSLIEHLIGGGFAIQDGSDPTIADPNNATNPERWFLQLTSGKGTSYAICLRESPAFFSPANAIDYDTSSVEHFTDSTLKLSPEASCPSGESILGGGYQISGSILAGSPVLISSSYPIVDGSGARWHVTGEMNAPHLGPTLQAFAICSGTVKTHLEHAAMKMSAPDPGIFLGDGTGSCTSGTLLSGGYQVMGGQNDIGLAAHIQTSAPGKSLAVNATTGDTFTDWSVVLNGISQLAKAKSVTGDVWVVCWDPNGQGQPTQITQATQTTQAVPTDTPHAQPTATNPPPACQVYIQGSANLNNVDLTYVNLDTSSGQLSSTLRPGDNIHWNSLTAAPNFAPVNGATISNLGTTANYGALGCSQLTGLTYGGGTVPYADGEVFAVKTPSGHYVKVHVSKSVGGPPPSIQWVTYKP